MLAPLAAARQGSSRARSPTWFSTPGRLLVPLVERLHVDGADPGVAALLQHADQVAADEATGAGDDHEIILGH